MSVSHCTPVTVESPHAHVHVSLAGSGAPQSAVTLQWAQVKLHIAVVGNYPQFWGRGETSVTHQDMNLVMGILPLLLPLCINCNCRQLISPEARSSQLPIKIFVITRLLQLFTRQNLPGRKLFSALRKRTCIVLLLYSLYFLYEHFSILWISIFFLNSL